MRSITILLYIMLSVGIAGCGISRSYSKKYAREDMEASKKDYKDCLRRNLNNPSECDTLRLIYEADMEAYKAMMGPPAITVEDD